MSDEFIDKYTDIKPELVFQNFEDKVDDMKIIEEKKETVEEIELTEEEKIQMKMTRTALCFSAGRFDEAMEGCTELINLDRSEEGYYYFMFLLHHRLILQ